MWVSGRVQGVWFRESCRDRALGAGVSGWVRNLDDGRVEVVLEGPPRARVRDVERLDELPGAESGFHVR